LASTRTHAEGSSAALMATPVASPLPPLLLLPPLPHSCTTVVAAEWSAGPCPAPPVTVTVPVVDDAEEDEGGASPVLWLLGGAAAASADACATRTKGFLGGRGGGPAARKLPPFLSISSSSRSFSRRAMRRFSASFLWCWM